MLWRGCGSSAEELEPEAADRGSDLGRIGGAALAALVDRGTARDVPSPRRLRRRQLNAYDDVALGQPRDCRGVLIAAIMSHAVPRRDVVADADHHAFRAADLLE